MFSDIFRGYRSGPWVENVLNNGRMDTGQFMAKLCQHLKKLSRILMQNLQSSFVFNKNSRLICSNFPTKNNFLRKVLTLFSRTRPDGCFFISYIR